MLVDSFSSKTLTTPTEKMSPTGKKHFLMISVAGFGHIIPMVAFMKRIAQHHKVTFAVPAFMVEHIRRKGEFPPGLEEQIEVLGLDDGIEPGMPEDAAVMKSFMGHATHGAPRLEQLLLEMPARTPPVEFKPENRLSRKGQVGEITTPVDGVIADVFLTSSCKVLEQRNIPLYLFNCSAMGPFRSFLYITENTPTTEGFDMESFIVMRPESEGPQPAINVMMKQLSLDVTNGVEKAAGFITNSFRGFDDDAFVEVRQDSRMKNLKCYFVGPLMPEEKKDSNEKHHILEDEVKAWLDNKGENTVVYAAFGSVSVPNPARINALGEALLKIGKPFILSIREAQQSLLPRKIQEMAAKNDPNSLGLLLPWAPQKVILAHPAVQVFVSHSGWNSTMEGIFHGKPIVGWPCFGDQLENALWIEESGMGKSLLTRDAANDGGKRPDVPAEAVAAAIEVAASDACIAKAKEWQKKLKAAVAPGGSSTKELEEFIQKA